MGVAAGLRATIAGILMMTGGDEIGRGGDSGEDGRPPMACSAMSGDDDGQPDTGGGDEPILQGYRGLISARNLSLALRDGGQRWVHGR